MLYFKGLLLIVPLLLIVTTFANHSECSKVTYKKPINSKLNALREKRYRSKSRKVTSTTTTIPPPSTTVNGISTILGTTDSIQLATTQSILSSVNSANTLRTSSKTLVIPVPVIKGPSAVTTTTTTTTTTPKPQTPSTITTTTTTTTESNLPVPCTCGVFLASQFKRFSKEPPKGHPVLVHELDHMFTCNVIGQKQCQTKCLETIIQYLPNSANILCASLDRDCHKERAYLFIKNCRNKWINTNITAGREYCCKDGKPYTCPFI